MRPGSWLRFAVIAMFIVVGVTAILFDRPSTVRTPYRIPDQVDAAQIGAAAFGSPDGEALGRSMPIAAPLGTASTTWFCGGADVASTTIVLTNRSSEARTATIRTVVSESTTASRQVEVPGHSTLDVPAGFAGKGTLAATVESRNGGVVATQRIATADTATTAACAVSSSASWFFAGGDTQRGAAEKLVLFNPFDDLATADVTFLTPDGFRHPQETQGLAVPGRSVVVVDVGAVQNRRSGLGAVVTTRAGRLVAWRTETFDGTGPNIGGGNPPKGVSVALGSTVPLTRFALPTAVTGDGVAPRVVIANPGATASTVQLSFAVDNPGQNGQPPPMSIELMSGAVEVLAPSDLRQVAAGVPFTVSGRVVHGGAVVAELWFDGSAPAKGHGSFAAPGSSFGATSWVVPVGLQLPTIDQLGVRATGSAATLRISLMVDGSVRPVVLPPGTGSVAARGRVTIDLAALLAKHPGATVVLDASQPVTVSRLQTGPNERGIVSTPAVPVAGTLSAP
ncbi:MAG: hypothetical protein JST73_12720 [Actinobacteria bacterium]|nr:hypothetical protein [Actinomycetota bacterium]